MLNLDDNYSQSVNQPIRVGTRHDVTKNFFLENGTELKKFCGKLSKKAILASTIRTSGNSIDVNFEAGNVSQRGFKLKIKAVPENSPKAVRTFYFVKCELDLTSIHLEDLMNSITNRL